MATTVLNDFRTTAADSFGLVQKTATDACHFMGDAVIPTVAGAVQDVARRSMWGLRVVADACKNSDVINMTLKIFQATMTLMKEIPSDTFSHVHNKLVPLSGIAKHTSSILAAPGILGKVHDVVSGKAATEDKIGDMPNFLKVISKCSLIFSDVITNVRLFVEARLIDAKVLYMDIARIEFFGRRASVNLDKLQAGLSITGFSFDLADIARKAIAESKLTLGAALSGTSNVVKITGTVLKRLPFAGAKVAGAVTDIASSVLGISNHFAKEFKYANTVII